MESVGRGLRREEAPRHRGLQLPSGGHRQHPRGVHGRAHGQPMLAHISNTPAALIAYSQQHGMLVEAYSPMAHGELFKNQQVRSMAEKYGVSLAQLSIRYTLQLGLLPLPKTANPDHMRSNADVDFEISADDMTTLTGLDPIEH